MFCHLVLCFFFIFAGSEEFQSNAPAECALECIRSHNYLLRKVEKVEDGFDAYNVSTVATITRQESTISELEQTAIAQQASVVSLLSVVEEQESTISELEQTVIALQATVASLLSVVEEQATSISRLEDGVAWQTFGNLEERTFRAETGELYCYTMTETKMAWNDLEEACVEWGGHLVSIHSDEENDFVFSLIFEYHGPDAEYFYDYWISGTDAASEGNWVWMDGTEWDYSNWGSGRPDDYDHKVNLCEGSEDYLHFYSSDGQWNDISSPLH